MTTAVGADYGAGHSLVVTHQGDRDISSNQALVGGPKQGYPVAALDHVDQRELASRALERELAGGKTSAKGAADDTAARAEATPTTARNAAATQ